MYTYAKTKEFYLNYSHFKMTFDQCMKNNFYSFSYTNQILGAQIAAR